ncbi:MAG: serine hydrolase [Bacteroidota bacterium]
MKKLVFSVMLFGAVAASHAQLVATARIDSFLQTMIDNHLFNGGVLVAEHGKIIYTKFNGFADFERRIPNSDISVFNLASLSKPFTSLAILQLVQKKKLRLEDQFARYFPDFPYKSVTIRHLLTHSSGVPQVEKFEQSYISQHPDEKITNEKMYSDLVQLKLPLSFDPGEKWDYSNCGYALLAMLVEKISGMSFAAYMKKFVFLPAGMTESYVRDINAPNTPRYIFPVMYLSSLENVDSMDHKRFYTYFNLGGLHGPNNIMSTLNDLFHFDLAISNGKLLDSKLLQMAQTPLVLNNGKVFHMRGAPRGYGMGWNIMDDPAKDKIVFHDGHIVGLGTMMLKNIPKEQTIIYYDNTDAPFPFQKVGTISRILNGEPLNKISTTRSLARVYGQALVEKGPDFAIAKLISLRSDTVNYYLDELEMNTLGYDLLGKAEFDNHGMLSLEVFKINTLLFKSANSFDSYAEALSKNGKQEEAISMYNKSLALNPNNEAGKKALQVLMGQVKP